MAALVEEKAQPKQNEKVIIPRYVVNCSADVRKFEPMQSVAIESVLQNIAGKHIYGYGIDMDKSGFEAVRYSLRGIKNHFISALHASFMQHLPFQLRPDDIWIIIAQGIATHIELNAEKLRETFVAFDDKQEIIVRDDSLDINSSDNDWSSVLNQFEAGCRKLSNDKVVDLITSNFSTTTPTAKAASQCVLFKALSEYISFRTCTNSGIPNITLIGSVQDWKKIQNKCEQLKQMNIGLDFWLQHLVPIVENIVKTVVFLSQNKDKASEKELIQFWDSIYSFNSESGGCTVSGWAKTLFPYLSEQDWRSGQTCTVQNHELDWQKNRWANVSPGDFPATYSMCPMIWDYLGKSIKCGMYGGIVGIAQQAKTGCMAPMIGWIIARNSNKHEVTQNKNEKVTIYESNVSKSGCCLQQ
eukprot:747691_1